MPNITYFTDHCAAQENLKGIMQNATNTVDFALANVTAADTVRLLEIPKGAIVKGVNVVIVTAAGAACTMDIGDGSTASLFDNNVDLNAVAGTMTGTDPATETTLSQKNGAYFASGGYVVGTMDHTNAAAKFIISMDYIILNTSHA